jgi:hypothetical protein
MLSAVGFDSWLTGKHLPNNDVPLAVYHDCVARFMTAALAKEAMRDEMEKDVTQKTASCKGDHGVER